MKGNINRTSKSFMSSLVISVLLFLFLACFSTWAGDEVPASAEEASPLKIGDKAPALTLKTPEKESFDLNAAIAEKPAILVFYRGRW